MNFSDAVRWGLCLSDRARLAALPPFPTTHTCCFVQEHFSHTPFHICYSTAGIDGAKDCTVNDCNHGHLVIVKGGGCKNSGREEDVCVFNLHPYMPFSAI